MITNTKLIMSTVKCGQYTNISFTHFFEVFVEGVDNSEYVNVSITNLAESKYSYTTGNTNLNNIINANSGMFKYKLTYSDNPDYYLIIYPNMKMIRGNIYGDINLSNCSVNYSDLKIVCFRGNVKIGEYLVTQDYSYNIPNLDINTRYDIILIDTTKNIEWIVSSNRKPNAYNTPENPTEIIDAIVVGDILKIEVAQDVLNSDYFKIYYSMDAITNNEHPYFISKHLQNNISKYIAQGYTYYRIENYFNNIRSTHVLTTV